MCVCVCACVSVCLCASMLECIIRLKYNTRVISLFFSLYNSIRQINLRRSKKEIISKISCYLSLKKSI